MRFNLAFKGLKDIGWYMYYIFSTVMLSASKQQPSLSYQVKGKYKAIPLQAWTGPEGYRR
jgi:hypothetical protein